ncbi:histidine kinase [Chloroflexota bacterium]
MNLWGLLPLISCLTFTALLILVMYQTKRRVEKVFAIFLFASAVWSFTSFMLVIDLSPSSQYLIFWNGLVITAIPWVVVTYYHFVRAYNNKPGGILLYISYALIFGILIANLNGLVVKSASLIDGFLYHDIKPWDYAIAGLLVILLFTVFHMLGRRYRDSTDSIDRNRTMYLIIGWSILVVISYITPFTPALSGLPIDHIGNLINALIIVYAIKKYKLLDMKLVVRKGVVYSTLTIFLTTFYLLLLFILQMFFKDWLGYSSLAIAFGFALVAALLFNPLRDSIQRWIDRIFYRETYDYRQMLLHFSDEISNVLDLNELSQSILDPVVDAMHVKHASLLFPENGTGDFKTRFTKCSVIDEPLSKLGLASDNPIVTWIENEGRAFHQNMVDVLPQLKGLWEMERIAINTLGIELICPIRSKGSLIGILALGEKQSGSSYSDEEASLLMTMANEAAVALENARMLDSLKSQQLQVEQLLGQVVLAQEEERNRISMDLHDSVAQWLVAASYGMQAFRQSLPPDEAEKARNELSDMEHTVTRSLRELRRVVIGLRPPALDELGLSHALKKSLEELKPDRILYKYTQVGEPCRLPSSMEITTYRVVQEALANIRKHAKATRVNLKVEFKEDNLLVEIRDNGQGFNLSSTLDSAISVGHLGLLGMKQRIDMLGGNIYVKTSEGKGTTISVSLPVQIPVEGR